MIMNLILDCYLEQHVQVGTKGKNILDLIFTSELSVQDDVKTIAPISNCDHNVLLCNVVGYVKIIQLRKRCSCIIIREIMMACEHLLKKII